MAPVTVSAAGLDDAEDMAVLLAEMGRFYGAAEPGPLYKRVRQINDALFSQPPAAYALLARDGARLAGFAAYSFLWPAAGLTRSLYLKELYVPEGYRHRDVGTALMRAIFETAARHACSRVEWTTDTGNSGAQAFYATLALPAYPAKIFYRIEDTGTGFHLPR